MSRIAMVAACPFPANFGSSASIRELSKILGDRGYDVHVVTYHIGDDRLPVGNAQVWRTRYWGKKRREYTGPAWQKFILDLLMVFTLIRVIRREKIDLIHAHNYEGVLIGMIAKLFTGRPLVYQAVNLMADELPSYNFIRPAFIARTLATMLDRLVPRLPDFVIVISKELETYFRLRGFGPDRMALIPPGVYPAMFARPDPHRIRDHFSIGDRKIVMYTGVSNVFQRIDYLLKAFRTVLAQEPAAVLMIVSPLSGEADLVRNQEFAASLGISESIIWVEGQSLVDLPDYLAAADITVIPRPDIPGYPLKLLNAMAAGKPTVCFAGAAKGVEHLRDAFIVPDHDLDAMGRGILTLLRDPALAEYIGDEARRTILTKFDWEILCTQVEQVYGHVLGAAHVAWSAQTEARVAETAPARISPDSDGLIAK
ncbi:MAG TPA: glycosyltransferase family 4 protein [Candidatus Binataceae bacterium]|nr:glycosyltransferase family 4 protein [Candidatus Binataceae bacterium]